MQENTSPLIWKWNKQPILLDNLDERQLISIKKSIKSSPNKTWFGRDSSVWLKGINEVIEDKDRLSFVIRRLRVQRALINADIITKGIVKCFKRQEINNVN